MSKTLSRRSFLKRSVGALAVASLPVSQIAPQIGEELFSEEQALSLASGEIVLSEQLALDGVGQMVSVDIPKHLLDVLTEKLIPIMAQSLNSDL